MKSLKILFFLAYLLSISLMIPSSWGGHWLRTASAAEVHVNLLGQPCLLSGPYDTAVLNLIHSLGPAQLYPNMNSPEQAATKEQVTRALAKIQSAKNLPPLLDRYRERLTRRLQYQLKYIQALQSRSPTESLAKLGREAIKEPALKKYENLLKRKTNSSEKAALGQIMSEQLFEIYNEAIEPDPEAEFHRAIKKLQIQYNCSFEENDPTPEQDSAQTH
jgi:hypothetical protein